MDADNLKCSLCLDFFTSPVQITSCGHSFCGKCLTMMTTATWSCPDCRTEQNKIPAELTRNYFLERIVDNFKETRKNICTAHDLKKKLRK